MVIGGAFTVEERSESDGYIALLRQCPSGLTPSLLNMSGHLSSMFYNVKA